VVFSKQTQDKVEGQLIFDDRSSSSPAQNVVKFSANRAKDILTIKIELSAKMIFVQKGFGSRAKEFYIKYNDGDASTFLEKQERVILKELASKLAKIAQINDLNRTLLGLINFVCDWPENRPLALEMGNDRVVMGSGDGAIKMTRKKYDSLKN